MIAMNKRRLTRTRVLSLLFSNKINFRAMIVLFSTIGLYSLKPL